MAFAVGHHAFYAGLVGTVVPIGNYTLAGFTISAQQANIASGTALAFLVKAWLVVAVGTAYTQTFWAYISGVPTTVSRIDVLAAALHNVLLLSRGTVWWRYPLLLLLALISWYVEVFVFIAGLVRTDFLSCTAALNELHPRLAKMLAF